MSEVMKQTIQSIVQPGKGILAADMSPGSIDKQFAKIGVDNTAETRRAYREMLFTTPELNTYISGVIQHEEALDQASLNGESFTAMLQKQGIVTGVKVDKGYPALDGCPGETLTTGLEDLADRCAMFFAKGARFTKWRATIYVSDTLPSTKALEANADALAQYAKICQQHDLVPMVEPEVLMDGTHGIEKSFEATSAALKALYAALAKHNVPLEYTFLKPNMVLPGYSSSKQVGDAMIAERTLTALIENVPTAVPAIFFLSGGQSDQQSAARLSAINSLAGSRKLSFSYGRALQSAPQAAWAGKNVAAGQAALMLRARCNSAAALGKYTPAMEEQKSAA